MRCSVCQCVFDVYQLFLDELPTRRDESPSRCSSSQTGTETQQCLFDNEKKRLWLMELALTFREAHWNHFFVWHVVGNVEFSGSV